MDTNESCLSQVMLKESDGLEAVRGSRKMCRRRRFINVSTVVPSN